MAKVILTVDDSATMRQMVRFTLSDAGYTVIEAVDGKDGLAKLTSAVHLVITDLNMPLPLALAWRRDNTSPLLANFLAEVRSLPGPGALPKK